jgi:hypothetical protein
MFSFDYKRVFLSVVKIAKISKVDEREAGPFYALKRRFETEY